MEKNMRNFKYGKKEVEFWSVTGEVLDSNKYSETQVSSSGGGGAVGKYGGHVSAPKISSSTVINHEFWIRDQDGSEKPLNLTGHDIPLRPGQTITMVSAGINGNGWNTIFYNHSAKKHWVLNDAEKLNTLLCLERTTGVTLLGSIALFFGALYTHYALDIDSFGTLAFASSITGVFLVYRLIRKNRRVLSVYKELGTRLDEIIAELH